MSFLPTHHTQQQLLLQLHLGLLPLPPHAAYLMTQAMPLPAALTPPDVTNNPMPATK